MLPREHRLRLHGDFAHLWRFGREARVDGLRVRWGRSRTRKTRVGIVIARRAEKLATRRNRIRRVIREAMRPLIPGFRSPTDIVFMATPGMKAQSVAELRHRLELLFSRFHLLH